jgi:hypothetical protein
VSKKVCGAVSRQQRAEQTVERPTTPPAGETPPTRADLIFGPKPVPWVHTNQRVEIATGSGRGARKVIWHR